MANYSCSNAYSADMFILKQIFSLNFGSNRFSALKNQPILILNTHVSMMIICFGLNTINMSHCVLRKYSEHDWNQC